MFIDICNKLKQTNGVEADDLGIPESYAAFSIETPTNSRTLAIKSGAGRYDSENEGNICENIDQRFSNFLNFL